jgi:TolA-binding protein
MRTVRTMALFLLGAMCIAAPAFADEQAQFDFANGLFARGFNEEAAAEYRSYLQQYPQGAQRPEALYRLGESEFALGKHAAALEAFDQFLAAFPQHALAVTVQGRKGVALYQLGKLDEAVAVLGPAAGADSASAEVRGGALYYLGKAHFDAKRIPEASAAFRTLVETLPDSPYTPLGRYQLAYVYLSENNLEQAAVTFSELASSAAANEELRRESRFRAAEAYDKLGWYDAAARAYDQLQKEFPNTEHADRALFGHAWSLYHAAKYDEAVTVARTLIGAKPDSPQAAGLQYLAGNCLQQTGKLPEALVEFQQVQQKYPESVYAARAQYKEGYLRYTAGEAEPARALLDAFLARKLNTGLEADAHYLLGMIAQRAGQHEAALALFDQSNQIQPAGTYRADAVYQAAQSLMELKRFVEAGDGFLIFTAEYPQDPRASLALTRVGDAAFELKDFPGAEKFYAQAIEKSTGDARSEALYRLAVARHNAGRAAESVQAFDQLLAEFPAGPRSTDAHLRAGQYWLATGAEPLKAIPHFEAALTAAPEGTLAGELTKGLALARYEAKDLDGAAQTFVKLIRQWPQVALNETTYAWTGQYLFDNQVWADAAVVLQALLDHVPEYPDRPRVALKVAECAERAEQVDDAYAKYEALVIAAPESPVAAEARFRQAGILEKKGETDRAVEMYTAAAESVASGDVGARARFRLGEVRAAQGQFAEAAKQYMRVAILYLHPQLGPEALLRAGQCFEQGGEREQAVKTYQEVMKDYPESEQAVKAKERLAELSA